MFNNPFSSSSTSSLPSNAANPAPGQVGLTPNTGALVPFGTTQQSTSGNSLFGNSTTFGASNPTQQPSTLFGASSASSSNPNIFASNPTSSFGTTGTFGGATAPFGASSSTVPAFGSSSGQNIFGGPNSSGFGSTFPSTSTAPTNTLFQTTSTNPNTGSSFGASTTSTAMQPTSQPTTLFGGVSGSNIGTFGSSMTSANSGFGISQPTTSTVTAPTRGLFGSGNATTPSPFPSGGIVTTPSPFSTTAASTLFGSVPSNTTGFGTPAVTTTQSPFGTTNVSQSGGGIFGTTATQQSLFGTTGTSAPSSMTGGASPFTNSQFGSTSTTPSLGTGTPPFSTTTDTDNQTTLHLQSISAMPAYITKSVEELRLEDYHRGRKAPGYGQPTTVTYPNTSTSSSGFGNTGSIFSSQPTNTSATMFGAQPTGTSIFGTQSGVPQQQQTIFGGSGTNISSSTQTPSTNNSMFQSTPTTFSQPTTTSTFFGAPSTGSNTSLFGTTSTNITQPFGTSSGTGQMSQQLVSQPSNTGFFGQGQGTTTPNLTSSFPSTASYTNMASNSGTNLFPGGITSSSLLFPSASASPFATSTQSMAPVGNSLFPTTNIVGSTTNNLSALQAPISSTPSSLFFSQPTSASTLTSGAPSGLSSSIIQPSLFSTTSTSNLFPSTTTTSTPISTTANTPSFTTTFPSSGMMGNNAVTSGMQSQYSTAAPLTPFTLPWPTAAPVVTPSNNIGQSTLTTIPSLSTPSDTSKVSTQFGKHPWLDAPPTPIPSPLNNTNSSTTNKSLSSIDSSLISQIGRSSLPQQSCRQISSSSMNNYMLKGYSNKNNTPSSYDISKIMIAPGTLPSRDSTHPSSTSSALSVKRSLKSLIVDFNPLSNNRNGIPKQENINLSSSIPIDRSIIQSVELSSPKELSGTRSRVQSLYGGFYISPPISDILDAWKHQKENNKSVLLIKDFLLGRKHFGDVSFLSSVDISFLPLEDEISFIGALFGKEAIPNTSIYSVVEENEFPIVSFGIRSITIYPEGMEKPSIGSGLNVPARIRLEGCYPRRSDLNTTTQPPLDPNLIEAFVKKLRAVPGTNFVSYDDVTGLWIFTVEHF